MQACRGGKFDYGVESESVDSPAPAGIEDEKVVQYWYSEWCELLLQFDPVVEKVLDEDETDGGGYSKEALPTEADFILAYATVPGSVSD